jgi:hypothetical protein
MEATKNVKEVSILAHSFDCLPGHVTIRATGKASTLRVAGMRAVEKILSAPELKRKRYSDFKMTLVVIK